MSSLLSTEQILQLVAWIFALLELVLALYVLLLNVGHTANRHVSGLLLLLSLNSLGLGIVVGATDVAEAEWGTILLSATGGAIVPALMLVAVAILKPEWMRGRWRWVWWPAYSLVALPILATVLDVTLNTRLLYTGLDPLKYTGGYAAGDEYLGTRLAEMITMVSRYVMGTVALGPLGYVALYDRKVKTLTRRLAWMLLVIQVVTIVLQVGLRNVLIPSGSALLTNGIFVFGYGYAAFQQMISERRVQRGRLQFRLTLLVVVITVPAFVAISGVMGSYGVDLLGQRSLDDLEAVSRALSANTSTWLDLNVRALQQLALLPSVVSMDAERQKPVLEAMAAAHPHMYLVSTTDLAGRNVARSDGEAPKDYSDRAWFAGARDGAPVTYQSLIGRTSGEPALVVSIPIRDASGEVIGVAMFASLLTDIANEVQASRLGETGISYVVDEQNRAIVHPDTAYSSELRDLTYDAPVVALRRGDENPVSFEDGEGRQWLAHVGELENGWGVIVQQQQAGLVAERRPLVQVGLIVVGFVTVTLLLLTWLAVRQAFRPIDALIDTAAGITAGDLTRVAPVESEDEIGVLARAFNRMTERLRGLIDGLEQSVRDRTVDLEQRSSYLVAASEVSRAAASILDPEELTQRVADLIRERFSLYYVGLFLVEESGQWAVLRAGTGEPGRQMLAQGHRLEVGGGSMIGRCVGTGLADVQLDVGEAAVRFDNPLLPGTRSELALPLRSRERTIGAMTVQSEQPAAFDEAYVGVLQTMADQVALAIENARLISESTMALEEARRASGERMDQTWADLLRTRPDWGYRYVGGQVVPAGGNWSPEMTEALQVGQTISLSPEGDLSSADQVQGDGRAQSAALAIPLVVRDQIVGVLSFRRRSTDRGWRPREVEVLELLVEQLGDALVGAQLYEAAQDNAAREQLVGELATRMRQTLDVESVLRTAVQEVRQALDLPEVVVRLRPASDRRTEGDVE
jgi:GAF domain-containing protein/HAMP domain-containing protein